MFQQVITSPLRSTHKLLEIALFDTPLLSDLFLVTADLPLVSIATTTTKDDCVSSHPLPNIVSENDDLFSPEPDSTWVACESDSSGDLLQ